MFLESWIAAHAGGIRGGPAFLRYVSPLEGEGKVKKEDKKCSELRVKKQMSTHTAYNRAAALEKRKRKKENRKRACLQVQQKRLSFLVGVGGVWGCFFWGWVGFERLALMTWQSGGGEEEIPFLSEVNNKKRIM